MPTTLTEFDPDRGGESPTDDAVQQFWDFSIDLYCRPGVAEAALRLQDDGGRDVNIAFYCLFAGLVQGRSLTRADLDRLEAAVAPWNRSILIPLRQIRRRLQRFGVEPFRDRVKQAELDAEAIAQRQLLEAMPAGSTAAGGLPIAAANLTLYTGAAAAEPLWSCVQLSRSSAHPSSA